MVPVTSASSDHTSLLFGFFGCTYSLPRTLPICMSIVSETWCKRMQQRQNYVDKNSNLLISYALLYIQVCGGASVENISYLSKKTAFDKYSLISHGFSTNPPLLSPEICKENLQNSNIVIAFLWRFKSHISGHTLKAFTTWFWERRRYS